MTWNSLGIINLNFNWQSFSQPIVNSRIFRLTQEYPAYPSSGKLIIAQRFELPTEGYLNFRGFWPKKEPVVFVWEIPQELINSGIVTYYAVAKLNSRARISASNAWTAKIEEFS